MDVITPGAIIQIAFHNIKQMFWEKIEFQLVLVCFAFKKVQGEDKLGVMLTNNLLFSFVSI